MNCLTEYYLAELTLYGKHVEIFSLVPPPPPPPPPPADIAIADYMDAVSKWKEEEMRPRIKEACQ